MDDHNSPEDIAKRAGQEDPIIMYLIVRESLGMSIGKTAAQVGHACQMLLLKYFEMKNDPRHSFGIPYTTDPITGILVQDVARTTRINLMEEWLSGSFRKVVLRADDKEWAKVKAEIPDHVLVIDNGLTEIVSGSETVIGLFPMKKSLVPKIIKRLQVLK
jgi:peptidyl-tRNA hydrolase